MPIMPPTHTRQAELAAERVPLALERGFRKSELSSNLVWVGSAQASNILRWKGLFFVWRTGFSLESGYEP